MLLNKTIELIKKYNIRLKDSLSQNFLINDEIKDIIIKELELKGDDTILEIGSGIGLLSEEIASYVKRLICIELDPNFCFILKENLKAFKNIEIINMDILKVDFSKILEEKTKVFGSIPYHITTPIILHLLKFREYISFSLLILQYEVSKRLIATSGKDYGFLSVLIFIFTKPEIIIKKIAPSSFIPKPKPYSSLIKLNFLEKPQIEPSTYFFKIVDILFSGRRKKIVNSLLRLKIKKGEILSILKNVEIDPNSRIENLTLFDIERLTKAIRLDN